MIKQGDILKHKDGREKKVLGICGEAYLLSYADNFKKGGLIYTIQELEENFIIPKEKWKPEEDEEYYYINGHGEIGTFKWQDYQTDNRYYNFGNCFQSEAEAIQARDKIKKLLSE